MSNVKFGMAIGGIILAAALIIGGLIAFSIDQGNKGKASDGNTKVDTQGVQKQKDEPLTDGGSSADGAGTGASNPLTGIALNQATKLKKPIAVMIDNHKGARPQSGFNKADIVYEILAEGRITRYMMVFYSDFPDRIGPIRSAREYFLDRAKEYSAIYVHAGGSKFALNDIRRYAIPEIDGLRTNSTFRVYGGKYAPHNLYWTKEKLLGDIENKSLFQGSDPNLPDVFKFSKINPGTVSYKKYDSTKNSFRMTYRYPTSSDSGYDVKYSYDAQSSKYKRFINGERQYDELDNQPVMPANVIVQIQPIIGYKLGKLLIIRDTGIGKGYLFSGGKAVPIAWKKASRFEKTEYFDKAGDKLAIAPGQTFIQVVPDENTIKW